MERVCLIMHPFFMYLVKRCMAANRNKGSKKGTSKTARYYQENPEARKKKNEYQKKYNKSSSQRKYRSALNTANRKAGTYGNGDGKDMSHTKSGKLVKESESKNRARNGSKTGRKKSAKRTGTKK